MKQLRHSLPAIIIAALLLFSVAFSSCGRVHSYWGVGSEYSSDGHPGHGFRGGPPPKHKVKKHKHHKHHKHHHDDDDDHYYFDYDD